jgi:hypothetical protein
MPPEQEARSTLPRFYSPSRSAVNPRLSIVSNSWTPRYAVSSSLARALSARPRDKYHNLAKHADVSPPTTAHPPTHPPPLSLCRSLRTVTGQNTKMMIRPRRHTQQSHARSVGRAMCSQRLSPARPPPSTLTHCPSFPPCWGSAGHPGGHLSLTYPCEYAIPWCHCRVHALPSQESLSRPFPCPCAVQLAQIFLCCHLHSASPCSEPLSHQSYDVQLLHSCRPFPFPPSFCFHPSAPGAATPGAGSCSCAFRAFCRCHRRWLSPLTHWPLV